MDPIITQRVKAVRDRLDEYEIDALMVSVQENRFYLSGFTGEDTQFDESAGVLIVGSDRLVLATDGRYDTQARDEAAGYEVVVYKKGLEQELPAIAATMGLARIGFESVRVSHKNFSTLAEALSTGKPAVALVPTENLVEDLRKIKSDDEIQRTIDALRLAEKAFSRVVATLKPGMTEKAVAWAMERTMRELGAQELSFPVIVAAGPNSALPHAIPSDRAIKVGEPVLFDWGARLGEYCSDTTRTVVLGKPDATFQKVFDTVVTARQKATAAIRQDASGTAVDRIARDYIAACGFEGKFTHSLGHGTGLAIHEAPRLSPVKDERLEAGMIVTVEPGVYLPGWGGIRMENQVVVTEDGARVLNDPTRFDPVLPV